MNPPAQPRRARRWRAASWAPVMVLVLLCVIITAINPNFLTFGNLVRISQTAMIPLVLGLGATFIILMGSIDLSVEGVLTLAAVILSMLVLNGANANDYGILGVFVVLLIGAGVGFVNGVIHVRLKVPSFMTTLGTWFIGVGIANALLGGMATRINDPGSADWPSDASSAFPGACGWRCCLAVALVIQNHTRLGRYIYALGGGEELAALSGIPAARVRIATFTSPASSMPSAAFSRPPSSASATPRSAMDRLFTTITAVVVGGTALSGGQGSVLQTLVGVLIVVVLSNGMVLMGVPPSVQIGVQGLMIIAAVALSIDRKLMRIVK